MIGKLCPGITSLPNTHSQCMVRIVSVVPSGMANDFSLGHGSRTSRRVCCVTGDRYSVTGVAVSSACISNQTASTILATLAVNVLLVLSASKIVLKSSSCPKNRDVVMRSFSSQSSSYSSLQCLVTVTFLKVFRVAVLKTPRSTVFTYAGTFQSARSLAVVTGLGSPPGQQPGLQALPFSIQSSQVRHFRTVHVERAK